MDRAIHLGLNTPENGSWQISVSRPRPAPSQPLSTKMAEYENECQWGAKEGWLDDGKDAAWRLADIARIQTVS